MGVRFNLAGHKGLSGDTERLFLVFTSMLNFIPLSC
jgi:hypothetical protein